MAEPQIPLNKLPTTPNLVSDQNSGGNVQGYSYDQLIGWVDLDLGSSPGWWPIL